MPNILQANLKMLDLLHEKRISYNLLFINGNAVIEVLSDIEVKSIIEAELSLSQNEWLKFARIKYVDSFSRDTGLFWKRLTKDRRPSFEKPVFVGRYSNEKMESAVGILDEVTETSSGIYFYFNAEGGHQREVFDFYAEIPLLPELKETE